MVIKQSVFFKSRIRKYNTLSFDDQIDPQWCFFQIDKAFDIIFSVLTFDWDGRSITQLNISPCNSNWRSVFWEPWKKRRSAITVIPQVLMWNQQIELKLLTWMLIYWSDLENKNEEYKYECLLGGCVCLQQLERAKNQIQDICYQWPMVVRFFILKCPYCNSSANSHRRVMVCQEADRLRFIPNPMCCPICIYQ